jgi:hypothetical protein
VHAVDPLRVTVAVDGWGLSGQQVAAELDARFGVVPELATQQARAGSRQLDTPPRSRCMGASSARLKS